jgi:hypothetical protein
MDDACNGVPTPSSPAPSTLGGLAVGADPVPPVPSELQALADATQDYSIAGPLLE